MKLVTFKNSKNRVKQYPYQLTHWLLNKGDLTYFINDFEKYKDEDYGIIARSPDGWAIFTKGKRRIKLSSSLNGVYKKGGTK